MVRGAKRYFTGKPCPRGHISERYVSTQSCVQCCSERSKKANPKKPYILLPCKIVLAAYKCQTRAQFSDKFGSEYMAASKRGWLPKLTVHMEPPATRGKWTLCRAIKESKKFDSLSEFTKASSGCVDFIKRTGIRDIIYSRFERKQSDFDAVYLWGKISSNGSAIVKYGITSVRLGYERINFVSQRSGIKAEFVILAKCRNAIDCEKELSKIGRPALVPVSGGSEFRMISLSELSQMYEVVYARADTSKNA